MEVQRGLHMTQRQKTSIYMPRRNPSEEPTLLKPSSLTWSLQDCEKIK